MDALKIALETIIVGALALPWMFLLVELFCPSKADLVNGLLPQLDNQVLTAVAGVLLFAMAYMVGSSVIRISEDFFNDDDLSIHLTEDQIRTSVYCQPTDPWLIQIGVTSGGGVPAVLVAPCGKEMTNISAEDISNRVAQTFAIQEGSLWLAAADKADRLRHLRQQIIVLRGAAFDGVIVTLLCCFGVCARFGVWGRRVLFVVALGLMGWAIDATVDHLRDHWHNWAGDPPLMEAVLIALSLAGLYIAWRGVAERSYACGFMFSLLLTGIALSGWWYTEILYSKTIVFFFYAQTHVVPTLGR